ncbi:hypothetical protein [Paenibacillus sinopodophylli]|uniref:hypothetical protein n=1 Tax=Paenibacillus sinopodophylli TaxID=1837342 RepID=UPI00110CB022|nr:hypothetical protein [Paenibacillus sinopodophylli]
MNDVSLFRQYFLRALYLLVVVGLGVTVWPSVIYHEEPWELYEGVVQCMLASFSVLCLLGLRYPLQMLPLLLWELGWKSIWLIVVAVPLWINGRMDESTWATASACLIVLIFPFGIPWRYVYAHFVKKRGDRWR